MNGSSNPATACGTFLAGELNWSFVVTFKEGRTPALWQEYQALRAACPENPLRREWGDGGVQEFRWVNRLDYQDSEGRPWQPDALECTERAAEAGRPFRKLFGSLKNVARRLSDGVRFVARAGCWFEPDQAGKLRVELDSS